MNFCKRCGRPRTDAIALPFRRAPGYGNLSRAEYTKLLRDKVVEVEQKAAAERREKGIKLLGRKRDKFTRRANVAVLRSVFSRKATASR